MDSRARGKAERTYIWSGRPDKRVEKLFCFRETRNAHSRNHNQNQLVGAHDIKHNGNADSVFNYVQSFAKRCDQNRN